MRAEREDEISAATDLEFMNPVGRQALPVHFRTARSDSESTPTILV